MISSRTLKIMENARKRRNSSETSTYTASKSYHKERPNNKAADYNITNKLLVATPDNNYYNVVIQQEHVENVQDLINTNGNVHDELHEVHDVNTKESCIPEDKQSRCSDEENNVTTATASDQLKQADAPDFSFLLDDQFDDDIADPTYFPDYEAASTTSSCNEIAYNLENDFPEDDTQARVTTIENCGSENKTEEETKTHAVQNGEEVSAAVRIDLEVEGQENQENANQIALSGIKKTNRKRSLVSQMLSNKNKHPIRNTCQCKLKCYEKFKDTDRHEIHTEYWSLNRNIQRVWMSTKVKESLSKRKLRTGRRNITRIYILPKKVSSEDTVCTLENIVVCQKFFLGTLGYNNANVLTALRSAMKDDNGNERLTPRSDKRGCHVPLNKKDRNLIISHINSFNPKHSHYTREHAPHRKYLPPDLTIKFMHNNYNTQYPNSKICYEVYRHTVKKLNIGFYEPNPEKCGFCLEKAINQSEENTRLKQEHLAKVEATRKEYKHDSEIKNDSIRVFAADMQKVVLLPRMPDVKETFFTSRLITFNETFAAMQKNGSHILILWHEAIAGRRSEESH